jgi:hypothetical protein
MQKRCVAGASRGKQRRQRAKCQRAELTYLNIPGLNIPGGAVLRRSAISHGEVT